MKTLKEEREAIVEAIKDYDENVGWVCYPDDVATALLSHEEKVRDERDTHWKEKVKVTYKDVERFGNLFWDNDFDVSVYESQRMADCINEVLLKRLTNEDNLK